MLFSSWLRYGKGPFERRSALRRMLEAGRPRCSSPLRRGTRKFVALALEPLETRLAPAVLTVNTKADVVNPSDGTLSLRDAISAINAGNSNGLTAGEQGQVSGTFGNNDTIQFASSLGGQTITLNGTALPTITQNMTITGLGAGNLAISGNHQSGIFTIASGAQVSLTGLTIEDGSASVGGGIANSSGVVTVSHCNFTSNSASGYGNFGGGAIYNLAGSLTVNYSNFAGNTSSVNGGGFDSYGAYQQTLSHDTFTGNKAIGNGGGVAVTGGGGTIRSCTFSGNTAVGAGGTPGGGGIYLSGVDQGLTLSNSDITGNSSSGFGGGIFEANGGGGSVVTINNTTIENNTATAIGGDGTGGGGVQNEGRLTISNSTLSGNSSNSNGGAIDSVVGGLTVSSCTFTNNSASNGSGGDIYAGSTGQILISNSTFSGESATSGVDAIVAGALTYEGGSATISDCSIENNLQGGIATWAGGDILAVNNCLISGNSIGLGNEGLDLSVSNCTISNDAIGIENDAGTLTVSNCVVSGNTGSFRGGVYGLNGGGIYNSVGTLTVNNSLIDRNSSLGGGGGIVNGSRGTVTVNNSSLYDNLAQYGGGGIWNEGTLSLVNSTVADNSVTTVAFDGGGGGIWNDNQLTLINSTVAGNSAVTVGGGIFDEPGSTATLNNTIVADDTSPGGDLFQYGSQGNTFTGSNDLISDGSDMSSFSNSLSGPALLAPLGYYGGPAVGFLGIPSLNLAAQTQSMETMALLPGSPAIDAGSSAYGGSTDERGDPRVAGTDIGAFESQGFTLTATSGNNQTAFVNTSFPNALTVTVTANNLLEPVNGGVVKFTAPNTGASATLSASTATISSSGTASVTATANGTGGTYTVTASASGAGTPASFSLTNAVYNFSGFLPPLSNGLTFALNRTIPIKFTLTDFNGNAVTTLSAITSLQILALDANGNPVGAPFAPASPNNQGLQFTGGQYLFNWQTKGLAAGSYQIVLKLADCTTHTKTIQLTASGNSAGLVTDGSGGTTTAGALLGGEVDLYVDNSNGDLTSDELNRIQDAVNSIDATIAPYGVVINEVTDPTLANVTLSMNTTSSLGSIAQGVLGCTTDADQVTMIQGWDWYAGSDATQVGAGQYDFETAVMHELGHVLGLGHSSSSSSVMYASLATGTANRALVTADLNVPGSDSGPCALLATPPLSGSVTSNVPGMPASSSTSVPNSGSSSSGANPLFAELTGFLSFAWSAYQSELSALSALWQQTDALAMQRLDAIWSLETGAMGVSKDTLIDDLFSADISSSRTF